MEWRRALPKNRGGPLTQQEKAIFLSYAYFSCRCKVRTDYIFIFLAAAGAYPAAGSGRLSQFFKRINQAVRRRVMALHLIGILQLRQDLTRQLFAQLDTPLIEREDIPDDALNEDLMPIQRDELTQGERGDLFDQEGIRRPVAAEPFIGKKSSRQPFPPRALPSSCHSSKPVSGQRSWTIV